MGALAEVKGSGKAEDGTSNADLVRTQRCRRIEAVVPHPRWSCEARTRKDVRLTYRAVGSSTGQREFTQPSSGTDAQPQEAGGGLVGLTKSSGLIDPILGRQKGLDIQQPHQWIHG